MDWVFLIGRLLFVPLFLSAGIGFHLLQRRTATEYARATGAPLPDLLVPLTGVMIIVGAVLIAIGTWIDLGGLLLAAFLLPTAYWMHGFWRHEDPQTRLMEQTQFMKDVALAGASLVFLYIAVEFQDELGLTVGPVSLFN